jgi:CRISPR/Cas system CMR subunit Cmr4 (Cas7 group RAMP superfamily)
MLERIPRPTIFYKLLSKLEVSKEELDKVLDNYRIKVLRNLKKYNA